MESQWEVHCLKQLGKSSPIFAQNDNIISCKIVGVPHQGLLIDKTVI